MFNDDYFVKDVASRECVYAKGVTPLADHRCFSSCSFMQMPVTANEVATYAFATCNLAHGASYSVIVYAGSFSIMIYFRDTM
jgi:hypothetical protein